MPLLLHAQDWNFGKSELLTIMKLLLENWHQFLGEEVGEEEQPQQKTAPAGSEEKAPTDVQMMIRYIEKIDTPAEYQALLQKTLLHAGQMKNTSGLKSFMTRIHRELPGLINKIK